MNINFAPHDELITMIKLQYDATAKWEALKSAPDLSQSYAVALWSSYDEMVTLQDNTACHCRKYEDELQLVQDFINSKSDKFVKNYQKSIQLQG